jgi:hypothetical protein
VSCRVVLLLACAVVWMRLARRVLGVELVLEGAVSRVCCCGEMILLL